ncbi:MAG: propionyl-CoA carboxylase [Gammaproteobacteria bacterium]|nr:propionyl-CoA carboxylase [Gammaproteobacteria bacterium]
MSWKNEVEEIGQRQALAEQLGGEQAVERQHGRGRQTIRERIDALVDPDSFQEVGKLTGSARYEAGKLQGLTPAPYVMGLASIDGRAVAVGGEDFTVRGGSSWGGDRRKGGQGGFVEDLAHEYRIPLVNLVDGAGGTVTSARRRGHAVLPGVDGFERSVELLGEVPVVSAVLGAAAGGPAARAVLSHWSVMVRGNSQIFAAGPAVVRRSLGEQLDNETLGGAAVAVDQAGTIDDAMDSEAECLAAVRRFLSYLPDNVWQAPPVTEAVDPVTRAEESLLSIVPRERRRVYDMRKLMGLVLDEGSVFELCRSHGRGVITALARIGGLPVGVVANNPAHYGGAMDVSAAMKQAHFVDLCDTFHLPLLFLVDVPGFMVGSKAEQAGTLRAGVRAVMAGAQARVPVVTVIVRKCYGMAGMATCNKNGLNLKIAWPSAEWGSLPVEGGVAVAYAREIREAPDPKAREQELEAELREFSSPFRTAEAFGIEDIIDPRQTRQYVHRFIAAAQSRILTSLGPSLRAGVRP